MARANPRQGGSAGGLRAARRKRPEFGAVPPPAIMQLIDLEHFISWMPTGLLGLLSSGRYIIFTRPSEPRAARGRDADDDQHAAFQSTGASPQAAGHGHQGHLLLSRASPNGRFHPGQGGGPP